ncbi:hypothetical protein PM1_044 [Pectobacterium phage PM1]|uniref:Uncharacterized protein n=2 Tax=Suwonvirus TaxID=2732964 RepID=X2CSX4_9CAUD|nr:virion structural protein [Pectobacterium phage PM1]YP_009788075.1 virion structural protein [Pectobacterium phage PP101]AGV99260.1 hypothetical protein PM1_044 [Pectobacterium phage PM1]APD19717.1 putative head-tail connector protein [Pectobacterium phage PP101]
MLTLPDLIARYPAFSTLTQARFDIFQSDAVLIMGDVESRWLGWYNPAMAALIGHLLTLNAASEVEGDAALTAAPVVRTDVDDVQVEFAERIWDKVPYVEADLYSTSYGQQYVRWRRMAFAGPRVA